MMKHFIIKKKKKKILHQNGLGFRFMVCPATFKNISVIWWRSVLLVEHRPVASNWQTLSHTIVSSTARHERDSNSQLRWWWALIVHVVVNPTTIRSRPRRPLHQNGLKMCCVAKPTIYTNYDLLLLTSSVYLDLCWWDLSK